MIKVETMYVIDIDDVCETFGSCMADYEFCDIAENDSYRPVSCDDGSLQELYEDGEWYKHKFEPRYHKIQRQIELVEQLRSLGHRGDVLVHVHW